MSRRNANTTATTTSVLTSKPDPPTNQMVPSAPVATAAIANRAAVAAAPAISVPSVLAPPAISATVHATSAVNSASVPAISSINNNGDLSGSLTFSKTIGGNAVFDLGDEDIDEDHFAAMLMEYNSSIPVAAIQTAAVSQRNATPVLYNEHTEDAQNDGNFYSAMVDFDPFISSSMDLNEFFDFQAASLPSPHI